MLLKAVKGGVLAAICGEFNIDMLSCSTPTSVTFSNVLKSFYLTCAIQTPTHLNSSIDNILVNFSQNLFKTFTTDGKFADHQYNFI